MFSDGTAECKSNETGFFLKKRIKCHPGGQSATEGLKKISHTLVCIMRLKLPWYEKPIFAYLYSTAVKK